MHNNKSKCPDLMEKVTAIVTDALLLNYFLITSYNLIAIYSFSGDLITSYI